MKSPALFLAHGSPMMALVAAGSDPYIRALRDLGRSLPRPRAILMISAHWYIPGKYVSVSRHPETIHDFYGFPEVLYSMRYPAPGFPEWAEMLAASIPNIQWKPVERWLDHGVSTLLGHLFPEADIPVFSISVDSQDDPMAHFQLGKRLARLRDEGILVIASGNIVHNLSDAVFDPSYALAGSAQTQAFDKAVMEHVESGEYEPLFRPHDLPSGRYAVPTPEHYLPMLTILGMAEEGESVQRIFTGYELGGVSRTSFGFFAWM